MARLLSKLVCRMRSVDKKTSTDSMVVVRVRPPLGPSDPGYDLIPQRFQRSMAQVTTPTSLGVDSPQGRKLFIFDRVFGEDTRQKDVWQYLEDSVDSFLQGYNVSILAYGQSGSGKSHTMGTSGPDEQRDDYTRGVVPRAAQHLFDNLQTGPASHSRQNSGLKTPTRFSVGSMNQMLQNTKTGSEKTWEMSVTYVEIYNEQPRDLLLPDVTPLSERPSVQIREDTKGRIFVEGLRSVNVNSIDELMGILNHGSTIRQTDATAINARSSRSHAVFTINLRQNKPQAAPVRDKRFSVPVDMLAGNDSSITVESKLHFVDLAGSERLKNTGATGDRAKEGISINAGLASLGKVISQLSARSSSTYVSYRDSKLTRMLQDSLGGNAITYMIACVTPAEFHLSETLNTVQYAQRARNIQSKPRIQQVQDDAEKQAVIDRLRSEVAFLRQQIRSAEGGDRRTGDHDRMERPNEREAELQNQLLDVQESYTTLSQRHAKLISELAKSGDVPDLAQFPSIGSESAVDRLKRSQAHQQQIEQMVLEYEKTIQSLEGNLSNTRGSLASTESHLLERETKCAFAETMNQQLNTRVQKMMDRGSSMEQYVHDLEARLEDQSSGGEKNDAILSDLRREVTRIRESESNAEDYICTLEERLAEADQDMEIMQREVERLEHLVDRQRSLGKLDNLLYELDHVQRKDGDKQHGSSKSAGLLLTNGVSHHVTVDLEGAEDVELPAERDDDLLSKDEATRAAEDVAAPENDSTSFQVLEKASASTPSRAERDVETLEPSPAQNKFMAEKFESVSQELFDLRLEHGSTVNDFDLLSAKYQEALRTLAEMQDSIDEARHAPRHESMKTAPESRPQSFLEDARATPDDGRLSSSRSLSSELSLAGESPNTTDTDITPISKQPASGEVATKEIERLQGLLAEHEQGMTDMSEQYAQLQTEHKDAMATVDKLRTQVEKTRPSSPSNAPGMFRRMLSQTGSGIDRGQCSIVHLRSMLAEELDGRPERLEGAEVHLTAATHELSNRNDRIHSLEAELKNSRRDMEMKTTIISGLTRERNSMKAGSPVDLSMVSQMRDQLIQKETELKSLHEGYARRESELQDELRSERSRQPSPMPPSSPGHEEKVRSLESRLSEVSTKHEEARQSHEETSRQLQVTKSELGAALASVATMKAQHGSNGDTVFNRAAAATSFQHERENYEDLINDLKEALQEQQQASTASKEKATELMKLHSQVTDYAHGLTEQLKAREVEVNESRTRLDAMEHDLKEAQSAVEFHKHGLKSLHEAHSNEIEEMKLSHAGMLAGYDDQMQEMTAKLGKAQRQNTSSPENGRPGIDTIVNGAQQALGHPTTAEMLVNHIQDLAEEKQAVANSVKRLNGTNAELERQLAGRHSLQELEDQVGTLNTKITNYQDTIRNLANEVGNHEETIRDNGKKISKLEKEIATLRDERNKKATIIEELEQQLQASFDQHHNRVSVIQAQGNQALVDAQHRIALLEKDMSRHSYNGSEPSRTNTMKSLNRPQSPLTDEQKRANSISSNLRKSASIASLPSPPPAMPLPPLPSLPGMSNVQVTNPSPPQSRHTSKEVTPIPQTPAAPSTRDNTTTTATLRRQSALIEEQEGRIRQVEKHLHAEKQLTATLEEALVDLETQSNKLRADAEGWKKKAWATEEELGQFRKEKKSERLSLQAMEEEVKKRREAEAARAQLEERMKLLQEGGGGSGTFGKKRRKGGGLNCF